MFSVKIGTTNSNGNGSSNNLSGIHEVLSVKDTTLITDDFYAEHNYNSINVAASHWNIDGAKEVKIDAINQNVSTKNFVDVDINLQDSYKNVDVNVVDSKRGQIETGSGSDNINVSILTNGGTWGELFTVDSGDGHDFIKFTDTQNSQFTEIKINAGNGHDTIDISGLAANSGTAAQRVIDAGDGSDLLIGSNGADTFIGGNGHDVIHANDGDDIIDAGQGADTIYAGNGNDVINAGADNDYIVAGSGNDVINAGTGNDNIFAGSGNDIIDGADGNDYIDAGSGNDLVNYDQNDDIILGGQGLDAIIVSDNANIGYNYYGFEAIVGEEGSEQHVTAILSDGLVVALGNDSTDSLSFTNADSFIASDAILGVDMSDFLNAQNIDLTTLNAYQASTGEIVWTDVDLLV